MLIQRRTCRLKTLPRFWRNQFYKTLTGAVLLGLCQFSFSQTAPLSTPANTEYPGIIQTFEKLIKIGNDKFTLRKDALVKNGRILQANDTVTSIDLDPDFLNSIILHSDPGYLRLASADKCRFYETILTDLLRSSEGKIATVLLTYLEKDVRYSAVMNRRDFLNRVVTKECPETQKTIAAFQIKTLSQTLKAINFDIPTNTDQCRNIYQEWLLNEKTPFLCQIHEYMKDARLGAGDPKDLDQRKAVARILEGKLSLIQKDYLNNLCHHLDDEKGFCEEFLNVSFWSRVAGGYKSKIYAEDICRSIYKTPDLSNPQMMECLARLKKEKDLCLYPTGRNSGLRPLPDCDQLSTALNLSSYEASFKDCPGSSDQMVMTNMGRIITHFNNGNVGSFEGACSSHSAAISYNFNRSLDNNEIWDIEACYDNQSEQKEVCSKTFLGKFANLPESYSMIVANILKKTRAADETLSCEMIDAADYNPLLLKYKVGCYIIYERDKCYMTQCQHRILYNDREINFIRLKGNGKLAYFPQTVRDERTSQQYLLTHDYKKTGRQLSSLGAMTSYFKKSRNGIVHGVGCAEELLPTFFKAEALNQCTALPFILNGMVQEDDKVIFVMRTAADSLQAPRLISWSMLFSAVKSYQRTHPLKTWTLYALD